MRVSMLVPLNSGGMLVGGNVISEMRMIFIQPDSDNRSTLFYVDVSIHQFGGFSVKDQVSVSISPSLLDHLYEEIRENKSHPTKEDHARLACLIIPNSVRRNYGC